MCPSLINVLLKEEIIIVFIIIGRPHPLHFRLGNNEKESECMKPEVVHIFYCALLYPIVFIVCIACFI